jgi:HCOMODA/2-hydroxy-3-carboxy-muconic semialdehyde decarboxylase
MRRHGATVIGGSLRELVFRTIYSAKNAEHQLAAHMLGNVSPLTAGEAQMAFEIHRAPGPLARAYEYWVRRLAEREGKSKSDPVLRAAEAAARRPNPGAARAKIASGPEDAGAKKKSGGRKK